MGRGGHAREEAWQCSAGRDSKRLQARKVASALALPLVGTFHLLAALCKHLLCARGAGLLANCPGTWPLGDFTWWRPCVARIGGAPEGCYYSAQWSGGACDGGDRWAGARFFDVAV